MMAQPDRSAAEQSVRVLAGSVVLDGDYSAPSGENGVVLFAHGSGSSRHSPRNRLVAEALRAAGLGALLLDLLTPEEERIDISSRHLRFDIDLLAGRLVHVIDWLAQQPGGASRRTGCFGASTGAGAALVAAARRPDRVDAVVSRGGRPDLAGPSLAGVRAPTLLIVGGLDTPVISMNREALEQLRCEKQMVIVPGATHLFEEPGTLEKVASLACSWFLTHLHGPRKTAAPAAPST